VTNPKKQTLPKRIKIEPLEMLRTSGKSMAQIERELGISPNLLSRWKARHDIAFDDLANKALFC